MPWLPGIPSSTHQTVFAVTGVQPKVMSFWEGASARTWPHTAETALASVSRKAVLSGQGSFLPPDVTSEGVLAPLKIEIKRGGETD